MKGKLRIVGFFINVTFQLDHPWYLTMGRGWEGQEREMSLKIIGGISKDRGSKTRIDFKPWYLIVHNIYKGEDSVVSR